MEYKTAVVFKENGKWSWRSTTGKRSGFDTEDDAVKNARKYYKMVKVAKEEKAKISYVHGRNKPVRS